MKKVFTFFLAILSVALMSAESYKITDYDFDVIRAKGLNFGKTTKIAILMKYPVDTNTVFNSKEELEKYIKNYKQSLVNTRAFEEVNYSWTSAPNKSGDVNDVKLVFTLADSNHFLALPYPKYDSNSGFNLKIKVKDTNFLGSLNPLSTDLSFSYNDTRKENRWDFGINFSYNYPFKAGIFNATWANSLSLNYTIGQKHPSLSTRIGVGFSLPKGIYSINFGAYQRVSFTSAGKWYFNEDLSFSLPITLYRAPNYSSVNYSPSISFSYNWNADEIKNKQKKPFREHLSLSFGHSLSNSKINWQGKFRKGYSLSLSNNFSCRFTPDTIFAVPNINFEAKYFNNFNLLSGSILDKFGINTRLYVFSEIVVNNWQGNQYMGARMRGIMNNKFAGSPYGVVLNLDLPVNIITTHFSHDIINFTMQFSPFFDLAFTKDKTKENNYKFNLKKIDYTTGMEVLVYPKKFSSYTIRASMGFDIKSALKEENKFKGLWHNKEIYIGLDLHY